MSATEANKRLRFGFIGGGKIAKAMAQALIRSNICSAEDICMSAMSEASLESIRSLGYMSTSSNKEVCEWGVGGVLFITVLPDKLAQATMYCRDETTIYRQPALTIVACAGLPLCEMGRYIRYSSSYVRIMPNILCAEGKSCTAYSTFKDINDTEHQLLIKILQAFGSSHRINDEAMDAYTALCGSGPAFVSVFIEALIDAGVACGLHREAARDAALHIVLETADILRQKGQTTLALREDITTPNGATAAGLMALEKMGFRYAVYEAIRAAWDRCRSLFSH